MNRQWNIKHFFLIQRIIYTCMNISRRKIAYTCMEISRRKISWFLYQSMWRQRINERIEYRINRQWNIKSLHFIKSHKIIVSQNHNPLIQQSCMSERLANKNKRRTTWMLGMSAPRWDWIGGSVFNCTVLRFTLYAFTNILSLY